ncbi:MAG: SGNH/GDSL hydrolase family protein, partial [Actinobacteria bacterium]|nr:SGNH/GDSL hydrolase family protein [Actinomycetota bacterium]
VRRRIPRLPEAAGPRSGDAAPSAPSPPTADDAAPLSLLVIGESTAVGVGAATQEEALAAHLARALAERSGRHVAWTAVGRSGATARDVLRDLVPEVAGTHDIAVVVLGVNDTLSLTSPRAWRAAVAQVIGALEPHLTPGGLVVLAGLPAVGRFTALPQPLRGVLGRQATTLDGTLATLAQELAPRVLHVPAPVLGSGPMQAVDRFHPSALGYGLWGGHLARETVERWTVAGAPLDLD